MAEGDDLIHFFQSVVHHIFEGGLFFAAHEVLGLDVAIDQDARHVLVFILDALAGEGLLDEHHGLETQAEFLAIEALDPHVLADIHLASHHEIRRDPVEYLISYRPELR